MCEITQMYAMRPLIDHAAPLELPTCMYKMRNLHSGRNGEVINDTGHVVNTESFNMVEIMHRQEDILRQLSQLRDQMVSLRKSLNSQDVEKKSPIKPKKSNIKIESYSAVININTTRPPYFLEILQKILKDTVTLEIIPHLHSTVGSWPVEVKNSLDRLTKNVDGNTSQNNLPIVSLRVIVKNIDTQAQLTIGDATIIGEVNILRYLARTIPVLRYEDAKPLEIDPILDSCYYILDSKTKSGRAKHIHSIFKKLGKSQWLCNEKEFTIADVAVYATLKHMDENELNATLSKYVQLCKSTFNC